MSVAELEEAVSRLSSQELDEFRSWFRQYQAGQWDQRMEDDARAGRLDALAAEAFDDLKSGRAREL